MNRREGIYDVLFPLILHLLCMLAATAAVLLPAGVFTGITDPERLLEEIRVLPLLVTMLASAAVLILQRRNFAVDEMRFGKEECVFRPVPGVCAVTAVVFSGHALSVLISLSGAKEFFRLYAENAAPAFEGQNLLFLIPATVLLGPVAEEVTFRWMMYRRMRARIGVKRAVVLTSLLFGLYHGNMVQFLYTSAVGVLLAVVYEKSRCLKLAVISHMALNLWAIAADPLYERLLGKNTGVLWLCTDLLILCITAAISAVIVHKGRK
jgi:membrane protease YdiL (CAAX protease family)